VIPHHHANNTIIEFPSLPFVLLHHRWLQESHIDCVCMQNETCIVIILLLWVRDPDAYTYIIIDHLICDSSILHTVYTYYHRVRDYELVSTIELVIPPSSSIQLYYDCITAHQICNWSTIVRDYVSTIELLFPPSSCVQLYHYWSSNSRLLHHTYCVNIRQFVITYLLFSRSFLHHHPYNYTMIDHLSCNCSTIHTIYT